MSGCGTCALWAVRDGAARCCGGRASYGNGRETGALEGVGCPERTPYVPRTSGPARGYVVLRLSSNNFGFGAPGSQAAPRNLRVYATFAEAERRARRDPYLSVYWRDGFGGLMHVADQARLPDGRIVTEMSREGGRHA